jgi:hypothetical protein
MRVILRARAMRVREVEALQQLLPRSVLIYYTVHRSYCEPMKRTTATATTAALQRCCTYRVTLLSCADKTWY